MPSINTATLEFFLKKALELSNPGQLVLEASILTALLCIAQWSEFLILWPLEEPKLFEFGSTRMVSNVEI